jgi:hypothetical protein
MVVVTIVTPENGKTIYFDEPLPEANYVRLLSCSFYNSWDTLKRMGEVSLFATQDNASVVKLPPGHYDLESMAKEISGLFKKYKVELPTETNTPVAQLVITNPDLRKIVLDRDLAAMLGIGQKLLIPITYVKQLQSPTTYFIHCDLIDTTKNLLNGKKSSLLAQFDIRGKPYEKVSYTVDASQNLFRDASTDKFFNSVTLTVKDVNGDPFDFQGSPLHFKLEMN